MMMYLLLANLYLGVFYLFYHVLLRRETFFNWNRFYLLSVLLLSFSLPLVEIPGFNLSTGMDQQSFFLLPEATENTRLDAVEVSATAPGTAPAGTSLLTSAISPLGNLHTIYIAGCLIALGLFLFRMLYTVRLLRSKNHPGAFSFFGFIRVDKKSADSEWIRLHEEIHAREWHSLDIMLMQVVKIFNWFNPVVYLMEQSLKLQHEYRADSRVARQNKTYYAELLLATALRVPGGSLTNQFINPTLVKSRIMMLLKNKTPRQNRAKFILAIPMIAGMVLLSAACNQTGKTSEEETLETVESTPNVADTLPVDTVAENLPPAVEPPPPTGSPRKDQVKMPEFAVVAAKDKAVVPATDKKDQVRPAIYPYDKIELPPIPPQGSINAFRNWFSQTLVTPQEAIDAEFSGRIDASFIVEPDGKLSTFITIFQGEQKREVSDAMTRAVEKVLENCPEWKPGIQDGQPQRVRYNLTFRINDMKEINGQ